MGFGAVDATTECWDEIFNWIRRVARTWVQRCERVRLERRQMVIRIELETQDDLGYYEYDSTYFRGAGPSQNE
jgi:hypothetical protein